LLIFYIFLYSIHTEQLEGLLKLLCNLYFNIDNSVCNIPLVKCIITFYISFFCKIFVCQHESMIMQMTRNKRYANNIRKLKKGQWWKPNSRIAWTA